MASACVLDWAGLIDAAAPWVDYAARMILNEKLSIDDAAAKQAEIDTILQQVETALNALKTIRAITAETHLEDQIYAESLQTHSQLFRFFPTFLLHN